MRATGSQIDREIDGGRQLPLPKNNGNRQGSLAYPPDEDPSVCSNTFKYLCEPLGPTCMIYANQNMEAQAFQGHHNKYIFLTHKLKV